jgi:transposase-like protein
MGIFTKGINEAAYRGNLNCPACNSTAIRFIENIGPYRLRYRCRKCGLPFQYETGRDMTQHPYSAFQKNKFRDIVAGQYDLNTLIRRGSKK